MKWKMYFLHSILVVQKYTELFFFHSFGFPECQEELFAIYETWYCPFLTCYINFAVTSTIDLSRWVECFHVLAVPLPSPYNLPFFSQKLPKERGKVRETKK